MHAIKKKNIYLKMLKYHKQHLSNDLFIIFIVEVEVKYQSVLEIIDQHTKIFWPFVAWGIINL